MKAKALANLAEWLFLGGVGVFWYAYGYYGMLLAFYLVALALLCVMTHVANWYRRVWREDTNREN